MPTVIRLKRGGRTHAPYYRVVVLDSRDKMTGRVIDEIGFYHPCAADDVSVKIDDEKAMSWLVKGAQPSKTVRDMLSKRGLMTALAQQKLKGSKSVEAEAAPEQAEVATDQAEAAAE